MWKEIIALLVIGLIIGLIGWAVYYPSYLGAQRTEEIKMIRESITQIMMAEEAYFSKHGMYISAETYPERRNVPLKPANWSPNQEHGFSKLGWSPKTRKVFCRYGINAIHDAYTIEVECNIITGEGNVYIGYVKPSQASDEGIQGPSGKCLGKGIYRAHNAEKEQYHTMEIGPCNSYSAQKMRRLFNW